MILNIKKISALIEVYIPNYIKEFNDDKIDLMDCYEIGFVFAHDLLRNKKIDTNFSTWGDGSSVIFEKTYSELLENIQKENISDEVDNYCKVFLDALEVFKKHFVVP